MDLGSISGIGSFSPIEKLQPMNYSVNNMSETSDVFKTDTTKQTAGVNGAAPVQYPNATVIQTNPSQRLVQNKNVSRNLNSIADSFEGNTTGYTSDSQATKYEIIGKNVDLYV